MRSFLVFLGGMMLVSPMAFAEAPATEPTTQQSPAAPANPTSVLDFTVNDIDGKPVPLSNYKGKVLLIVNVASKCGNTVEYKPLEELYEADKDKGFAILGFPANDFGHQEPGTNGEIKTFCTDTQKVTFDLFAKIVVKGDGQAPLYQFLTSKTTDPEFGGPIAWNFAKFLISRDGKIVARFDPKSLNPKGYPKTKPDDEKIISTIEAELAKPSVIAN